MPEILSSIDPDQKLEQRLTPDWPALIASEDILQWILSRPQS
jgi:hypothetical protein